MKLHILPADLSAALDVASKTVARKGTIPVLEGVLIEALADGGCRITGTDTERRAWRTVSARVDQAGSVILAPDPISSMVDVVPSGNEIEITVNDKHRAVLVSGSTRAEIKGMPADDFPIGQDFDGAEIDLTVPSDMVARLIMHVAHAANVHGKGSSEAGKIPTTYGIQIESTGSLLRTAAADGYRAAADAEEIPSSPSFAVVAHMKGLSEIVGALKGTTSARIKVNDRQSHILIDSESGCWTVPLIDGNFPPIRTMAPKTVVASFTVRQDALRRALEFLASIETNELGHIVRLSLNPDSINVWAGRDGADRAARTTLEAETSGGGAIEPMLFNHAFLLAAVKSMDCESVRVEIGGRIKPCAVRPAGGSGERMSILMPIAPVDK